MLSWLEDLGGPTFLVFIGAVLSAVGAFWVAQRQASKSDEIARLNQKIASQQEQLAAKSIEIANLNRETMNSIIGGDSFCYLALSNLNDTTNKGLFIVVQQGKYNLYDVYARIVDLEKFAEVAKSGFTLESMQYTDTNVQIGNLIAGHARSLFQFDLGDKPTRQFNVFFSARNGTFNQLLRFRKIDGRWFYATRVDRGLNLRPFEHVQPGYPRNAQGQIDW